MYKNNRIIEAWKNADKKGKVTIALMILVMAIVLFGFSAYIIGSFIHPFDKQGHSKIYLGLTSGLPFTIVTFLIISVILLILIFKTFPQNVAVSTDERGVSLMQKGTRGTAHFATEEEKERFFTIGNIKDTNELVFGQLTENGEQVVAYKHPVNEPPGTRHVLVIGPSGLGKTQNFVYGNIVQAVKRGISMIVVDPSTQIYTKEGQYIRNNGYDVKLLNCADLDHSETYDILSETIDPKTERIDPARLQSFARIYTKNSAKGDDEDYWYGCAVNLIETIIGYASYKREKYILDTYIELYNRVTRGQEGEKFENIITNEFVSFPWCEDKIIKAAKKYNQDLRKVIRAIKQIKKSAPAYNIEEVYTMVNDFKKYEAEFGSMPKYHPGSAAFKRFQSQDKDSVKNGAIQGAQMKFKIFDNPKLRKVLSTPGINFNTINTKKSAYFMAIPDTDLMYRPIASLFFSFFFKDAQQNYDSEEQKATLDNRPNRCLPVMCMMDEFSSLGVIMGDPDEYGTVMSDVRKREIFNIMICQYYSQLEGNYGKYVRDGIVSNCTTSICLGANDESSKKFFAEACGVATVMQESHIEQSNLLGRSTPNDNSMNISATERYLLTPDEIGNMTKKVLIKRHGAGPLICNLFNWEEMPEYKSGEIQKVSYLDSIKSLYVDPWDEYNDKTEEDKDKNKTKSKEENNDLKNRIIPIKEIINSIGTYKNEAGEIIDEVTKEVVVGNKTSKQPVKKKGKNMKTIDNEGISVQTSLLNDEDTSLIS